MGVGVLEFISNLEKINFFDEGLLIVTSDQRWTARVTTEEIARYGDSAPNRIPLLLIGRQVVPGYIDTRFVHQSDLIVKLPELLKPKKVINEHLVSVGSFKTNVVDMFDLKKDPTGRLSTPLLFRGVTITAKNQNDIGVVNSLGMLHSVRALYQKIIKNNK